MIKRKEIIHEHKDFSHTPVMLIEHLKHTSLKVVTITFVHFKIHTTYMQPLF